MCAAKHGHVSVVKLLIEAGAELDLQDTEVCVSEGMCSIIHACMIVHNTHACLQNGCTALTVAAQASQVDIVRSLLDSGADLNIQEKVCVQLQSRRCIHL